MNIKKSIATFAVASLAVAGLAACGGNKASSEDTDLTYPEIELGTTGTDLETTITFYNGRTDMGTDTYKGKNWATTSPSSTSCTRASRSMCRPTATMRATR